MYSLFIGVLAALSAVPSLAVNLPRSGDIPTIADNQNPTCAPWYAVRDAIMGEIFHGRCNDLARASVRLAFHDAGPFSLARKNAGLPNGASDGSLLTDPLEVQRPDNNGLQTIVGALVPLLTRFGVSPGDVLHLAGTLGVVACPGGPVVKTYVGRTPPLNINPDGLLPSANSPVPTLTARFADMGFDIRELMALIGAHTTGKQRFQSATFAGNSFDSSVDIWDVKFYSETQGSANLTGTFKLNSDVNFSHHSSTKKDYDRFVGSGRQDNWAREYADAHEKMSLLGYSKSSLTDCTEIMPKMIDLDDVSDGSNSGSNPVKTINPAKLEAAIQRFRSIWL